MVIYGANYFFGIAGAELRTGYLSVTVLSIRKVALYVESTLNYGSGVKQLTIVVAAGKATAGKVWSRSYKTLQVHCTIIQQGILNDGEGSVRFRLAPFCRKNINYLFTRQVTLVRSSTVLILSLH